MFGEMDGPGAPLPDKGDNAPEEAARVGVRRLDQEGNFWGGIQQSKRVIGMALIEIAKNHGDQSQMHMGWDAKIKGEMRGISWFGVRRPDRMVQSQRRNRAHCACVFPCVCS